MEFDEFVLARGAVLLRFAVMLCGDLGRAEDIVQTVLIRAYPRWAQIVRMEHRERYLKTVILNEHLRWWRRRSNTEVPTAELAAELADLDRAQPGDVAEAYASRDAAWALLGRLPRRQRAVLVLRYYESLSDAEIAATLGCRQSTVRSQAARGLAALRAVMGSMEREARP